MLAQAAYDRPVSRTLRGRLLAMLLLWIAAYAILMTLFVVFGESLNAMPLPLRVLIVSAVLVVVMSQVVIPIVTRIVARYLARTSGESH